MQNPYFVAGIQVSPDTSLYNVQFVDLMYYGTEQYSTVAQSKVQNSIYSTGFKLAKKYYKEKCTLRNGNFQYFKYEEEPPFL